MKKNYEKPMMTKIEFSHEQIMFDQSTGGYNTYLDYTLLDIDDGIWYTID